MASEMRRIARSLVERRARIFPSRHSRGESEARAKAALAALEPKRLRLETRWIEDDGALALQVEFIPAARTHRYLRLASLVLVTLIASSVWAVTSESMDRSLAFLIALVTALAVLALPFGVAAFGAEREAEEARLARALRNALTDEDGSGAGRSR